MVFCQPKEPIWFHFKRFPLESGSNFRPCRCEMVWKRMQELWVFLRLCYHGNLHHFTDRILTIKILKPLIFAPLFVYGHIEIYLLRFHQYITHEKWWSKFEEHHEFSLFILLSDKAQIVKQCKNLKATIRGMVLSLYSRLKQLSYNMLCPLQVQC